MQSVTTPFQLRSNESSGLSHHHATHSRARVLSGPPHAAPHPDEGREPPAARPGPAPRPAHSAPRAAG